MADYYFAKLLRIDEETRQNGWDAEGARAALIEVGGIPPDRVNKFLICDPPGTRQQYGISETELAKYAKNVPESKGGSKGVEQVVRALPS
jgi:hypothetical protein